MKQLITITHSLVAILILGGCASNNKMVTPSQNSALNSVSKSTAAVKKEGIMQKSLDSWLKTDWEPTINKDKKIQKKYLKKETANDLDTNNTNNTTTEKKEDKYVEREDKNFTLQEYVDKAEAYSKAHSSDKQESNVKKLDAMPVIGK